MKRSILICLVTVAFSVMQLPGSAQTQSSTAMVKLITLDPGHFHAALVQKEMYAGIDSNVYVYAPKGDELSAHLKLIQQYNSRTQNATHWAEKVYTGNDYLQKMLTHKKGNVLVLSGNNQQKTTYIQKAVNAGLNVLGDKPMAINYANFLRLQQAFNTAKAKGLLLYDIMTERSEITNILQKELMHMPALFGELTTGSNSDPAVVIESVHFYYKYVSGNVLRRPAWFFDPAQQGDAIADVGTHLIDLVQWEAFPGQSINYKTEIRINSAKLWPTPLSLSQFTLITGQQSFPSFLKPFVTNDTTLLTHGNGEINYTLKNIHTKIIARWEYQAPAGSGDTHYALFKGTNAYLEIKQGQAENYQPTLYLLSTGKLNEAAFDQAVNIAVSSLANTYPGITAENTGKGYKLNIPQSFKIGHEAHFGQVMQRYLQFLKDKKLPDWEVPCMLAKYYTSTRALEIATGR